MPQPTKHKPEDQTPMTISTTDLLDANPDLQCLGSRYIQYGGLDSFSGPVRTVDCRLGNPGLRELLSSPGSDSVIVVDGGGSQRTALLGDRMGRLAVENGWRGLIIEGAVRDTAALVDLPIGIKALGATPRRSEKPPSGAIDGPVSVGGLVISSGDYIWSDLDGVVVAPETSIPDLVIPTD